MCCKGLKVSKTSMEHSRYFVTRLLFSCCLAVSHLSDLPRPHESQPPVTSLFQIDERVTSFNSHGMCVIKDVLFSDSIWILILIRDLEYPISHVLRSYRR